MPKYDSSGTLADYYRNLGLSEHAWHIGPEHPALEELGLRMLGTTRGARVLELGVQSGGFAVPVILAAAKRSGFAYMGVDSLEYTNAVPLRLIAEYLERHDVPAAAMTFVEGDSTTALRSAAPSSYDLILFDHYKPKYPIDLQITFQRRLLSDEGVIVLHDVLAQAANEWKVCERVCRAYGYTWTIETGVSQGAAVLRRKQSPAPSPSTALVAMEVTLGWYAHAAVLRSRRAVGRFLRIAGLRS